MAEEHVAVWEISLSQITGFLRILAKKYILSDSFFLKWKSFVVLRLVLLYGILKLGRLAHNAISFQGSVTVLLKKQVSIKHNFRLYATRLIVNFIT